MNETEVKILDIDRREVEDKLLSMGARKTHEREVHAKYYDFPDKRIKKRGDILRLRKMGEKVELVYKVHISEKEAKIMKEHEVTVSDFDTVDKIFGLLGFEVWHEHRKTRTTYELNGAHFEIDEYKDKHSYIPVFLEIETEDMQTLENSVKRLGYEMKDCTPWTVVDLMKHYSPPRTK